MYSVRSTEGIVSYASESNTYNVTELPPGKSLIIYEAFDGCNNVAYDTTTINVKDDMPPVAICNEHTVVSLSIDEESDSLETSAKVFASSIDDGSFDNCNEVWLKVLRMDMKNCDSGQNVSQFGDYVQFCCDDLNGNYQVALRVFEKNPGEGYVSEVRMQEGGDLFGMYTDCMALVELQDKLPPQIVAPTDLTVSCDVVYDIDNLAGTFGDINVNQRNGDSIFILDRACPEEDLFDIDNPNATYQKFVGFGGYAYDACDVEIREVLDINMGCDEGEIRRIFTAEDISGNITIVTQTISIQNCISFYISDEDCSNADPFDGIIWPCDYYFENCEVNTDTSVTGSPIIPYETCQLIGIKFRDIEFEGVGDGCYTFLREWRIIDECQFEVDLDDYHVGEWRYYQEIHVANTTPPSFANCENIQLGVDPNNCDATLDFTMLAIDDCTSEEKLQYKYYLDINNDQVIEDSLLSSNISTSLEIGIHRIIWYVFDGCANLGYCEQLITVKDNNPPQPYCYNGLSTSIDESNTSIEFWASDFDLGSYDDCTNPVFVSFSPDTSDNRMLIDCNTIDKSPIDTLDIIIWITDASGNQSTCSSYLIVESRNDVCSEEELIANISGEILNHTGGETLENVSVEISADYMEKELETNTLGGYFMFEGLKMYEDYLIKPTKNDDVLNGVTTLDLVLIQKHILGLEELDNPFDLIAADINNSNKITASDLLDLRKVILGIKTNFLNNNSWRFVPDKFSFLDPQFPWIFPEQVEINNLSNSEHERFMGVKIGDVNGSVKFNASPTSSVRNKMVLDAIYSADQKTISIQTQNLSNFVGYQLSFSIKTDADKLMISSPITGFSENNYHIENRDGNTNINISFNALDGLENNENVLFVVHDIEYFQELNLNNSYLNEMYDQDLNIQQVEIRNIEPKSGGVILFQNKPNPFNGLTEVSFFLPEGAYVNFSLSDIEGRKILTESKYYHSGTNEFNLDMRATDSGIYYLQMNTGDFNSAIKLILLK
jgi:hypothetical protein